MATIKVNELHKDDLPWSVSFDESKCLAFHPYPQVIPKLFNAYGFGPPLALTPASTCSWIDHFVSGLQYLTKSPYSDSLSLRLRVTLTLPDTTTRRLIMQKAVHHPGYTIGL